MFLQFWILGATYAKEIVIEIDEDRLNKIAEIEQRGFDNVTSDPEFQRAGQKVLGDTANELLKSIAKLITHERGILMPTVRALTKVMNAMFIKDKGCNKAAFESCLSAVPRLYDPLTINMGDWKNGRLRQCSEQSNCIPKYNLWDNYRKRKFERKLQHLDKRAAMNFQKLAQAFEKAWMQWTGRNLENFNTIFGKIVEQERAKCLEYGCNQKYVDKCYASLAAYKTCGDKVLADPSWETKVCGCDGGSGIKITAQYFQEPVTESLTENTSQAIDEAGAFNCGMIY